MTTTKTTKGSPTFLSGPFFEQALPESSGAPTWTLLDFADDEMPGLQILRVVPSVQKLNSYTRLWEMVGGDATKVKLEVCGWRPNHEWAERQRFAPFITNRMIQQTPQKISNRSGHDSMAVDTTTWQSELPEGFLQIELLQRLKDGESWDQMREAVLLAETTSFNDDYRPMLLSGLHQFIDTYKFVDDEQAITAVCAALRKYILNMLPEHADYIAALLAPSDTKSLPNLAELTIVKSFFQYLQLFPVQRRNEYAAMEKRLGSIASDYLKPRLIQQKNFDAISLNALLCLALLGSPLCKKSSVRLKRLSLPWFSELFVRRLDWLTKEIAASKQSLIPEVTEAIRLLRSAK